MTDRSGPGAVIPAGSFVFHPLGDGCELATVVGPHLGAEHVVLEVVRVPAGREWDSPAVHVDQVVVVFEGRGKIVLDGEAVLAEQATSVFAPSGSSCRIAAAEEPVTAYLWRTPEPVDGPGTARRVSSLWNDETQLTGFAGTEGLDAGARPATMNFVFWPGTGSARLCLHCGMQQPGEAFNVHTHPESDEAFIVVEGTGQVYLADRWIDVGPGDVLFARPGVPHGTRNPADGPGARFSTCGGPTPFDPMLYHRAGVSAEVR